VRESGTQAHLGPALVGFFMSNAAPVTGTPDNAAASAARWRAPEPVPTRCRSAGAQGQPAPKYTRRPPVNP